MSLFAFKIKINKKMQCLTPCFDIKNLRIYFSVFWESLGVYIKKLGYFWPTRQEIKKRSQLRTFFRGSKSPERDFDNWTSYPAPRQLYESTFKNRNGWSQYLQRYHKSLTCYRFSVGILRIFTLDFAINSNSFAHFFKKK